VGIGLSNPTYQLQLSTDSAAKPTSSTWTISSDRRIKKDIQEADLERCYNDVMKLKLSRFSYINKYIENSEIQDKTQLGFIAQEVKEVFPKAVQVIDNQEYGIRDFHTLDVDQLIKSLFGCVKYMRNKMDENAESSNQSIGKLTQIIGNLSTKMNQMVGLIDKQKKEIEELRKYVEEGLYHIVDE
jgi:hypothetical protein